jgi:hypothetical protein
MGMTREIGEIINPVYHIREIEGRRVQWPIGVSPYYSSKYTIEEQMVKRISR